MCFVHLQDIVLGPRTIKGLLHKHAGIDAGGTPGGRKMSHPGQAPCPKRTNAKTLGGKGDPNTKQPFLKKILQVSGSAGASTLICLMGVSRGAAPNENAAINV